VGETRNHVAINAHEDVSSKRHRSDIAVYIVDLQHSVA